MVVATRAAMVVATQAVAAMAVDGHREEVVTQVATAAGTAGIRLVH